MGTERTRDFKLGWLGSKIRVADNQGISLDKMKLLNAFCLECNSTMRTAEEILKILIETGQCFEKEGDIFGLKLNAELFEMQEKLPFQLDGNPK